MKAQHLLITVLLLFSLLWSAAAVVNAQPDKQLKEANKLAEKERKEQEKQVKLKQRVNDLIKVQVSRQYDRFKDATSLSLEIMPVYIPSLYTGKTLFVGVSNETHFYVNAGCDFNGSNPQSKSYTIGFVSKQLQDYWFRNNRTLTMLIDGERLSLGETSWDGNATPLTFLNNTTYITNEAMLIDVSEANFVKIANARKVEFQLGDVEGELSAKHLEAFRALIANANGN